MARDRAIGGALVAGAVIGVIIYGFLLFWGGNSSGWEGIHIIVLEITAFVAVAAILAILGWIGYVMATTPPPVPLEPEPTTTSEAPGSAASQQGMTSEKKA